jgi:hypothetical protein
MQMKEMGRRSREGEKITWSEGACLLSSAVVYDGWTRWRCYFSSSSPYKGANPCVFSSSFSFCFLSFGSLLSISVLLLYSFCLFLCFVFSLFFPFFPPLFFFLSLYVFFFFLFLCFFSISPVFIGKKQGERDLLPLSSLGTGVGWSWRPLCSHLRIARGARPLCFSPRGRPHVRV